MASFSARREDHFQKMFVKNRPSFPSDFIKLVSEILYLFLAEKIVVCLVVCFVATLSLSDFGLHFFLIEALIELRKMLIRKKLFNERLFAHCSTPKVLMFCRFTGFTKMQLI